LHPFVKCDLYSTIHLAVPQMDNVAATVSAEPLPTDRASPVVSCRGCSSANALFSRFPTLGPPGGHVARPFHDPCTGIRAEDI